MTVSNAVFEHEDQDGDRLTVRVPAAGGFTVHVQDARPGHLIAAVYLDDAAADGLVAAVRAARAGGRSC